MKKIVLVVALAGLTLVASRVARAADIEAVLDDAAGASAFSVKDSGSVEGAHIDSDGNMVIKGGLRLDASGVENTTAENLIVDGNVGIGTAAPIFLTDILSGTANTGANVNNPSQLSITGASKTLTGGGATVFINSNSAMAADTGGSIALTGRSTDSSTNSIIWATIKGAKESAVSANQDAYLAIAVQEHGAGALVERMRINSDGNVGIGTAPTEPLHIKTATGAVGIKVESTATTNIGSILTLDHNSASPAAEDIVGRLYWTGRRADNNSYWTSYIDSVWTDPATLVGTSRLAFHTRNGDTDNTAMTIDHTGNVGIGTAAPTGKLHVSAPSSTGFALTGASKTITLDAQANGGETVGRAHFNSAVGSSYAGTVTNPALYMNADATTGFYTPAANAIGVTISGAEKVRIDTTGNVGIGTTAPGAPLDVLGSNLAVNTANGNLNLRVSDAFAVDIGPQILFKSKVNAGGDYGYQASIAGRREVATTDNYTGYLQFSTANSAGTVSEKVRITSGGDVGIGTTGPAAKLHVQTSGGAIGFLVNDTSNGFGIYQSAQNTLNFNYGYDADSDFYINYHGYNNGDTRFRNLRFANGKAGDIMYLQGSTGNVGIGTTAPQSKLQVDGGYMQLDDGNTAAPAAADCDAAAEEGRMFWDATNDNCYICSGASGWRKIATVAP